MKKIKIKIPEECSSGTKEAVVPDNTGYSPDEGFAIVTKSMDEEWDNFYSKKGVFVCEDIITPTGELKEQETTIFLEDNKGNLVNTLTMELKKQTDETKDYAQWTFTADGKTIFLPDRLLESNNRKGNKPRKRVDINRAALIFCLHLFGIPFKKYKSAEASFKLFEENIKKI